MKSTKRLLIICCVMVSFVLIGKFAAVMAVYNGNIYLPIVMKPGPTATSVPTGVRILPNHSYYIDRYNQLHVVGEVQNNTDDYIQYVEIVVNFYDSNGQFRVSDYTTTILETIHPGDKTCFDLYLPIPPDWSYCQFEAPKYAIDGIPLPNLTVIESGGEYYTGLGWYEITGQIRNDHGSPVDNVRPIATLYDATGTVLGCDYSIGDDTYMKVGQIINFKLTFSGRDFFDVSYYRLQVGGNEE